MSFPVTYGYYSYAIGSLRAQVSEGVFRSGYPIACNFPFLRRLGLRSILCLCPESVLSGSLEWANEAGVNMEMCDLGENSHPFVSMPLTAMGKAVDFLSGAKTRSGCSRELVKSVQVSLKFDGAVVVSKSVVGTESRIVIS